MRTWVEKGQLLTSEGPYFIKGVCYHPVEKGADQRSFDQIEKDLHLMQEMGVNTIRVYEPIESVEVLDLIHGAGLRVITGFGYNQKGKFDVQSGTYLDYVNQFKSHPAILLWELGNEYNYHPEWFGGDIAVWYNALREAVDRIHHADHNHPVSTAHGEVPDSLLVRDLDTIDLWGLNVYRWDQSHTAAEAFGALSDKPVYFSEAGADSYMAVAKLGYEQGVNERAQADATRTMLSNILASNSRATGVLMFSFTDGWWKAGAPDQQDAGGWAPGSSGVPYDGTANEEYWGLVDLDRQPKLAYGVVKSFFKSHPELPENAQSPSK
jgi:exo-beta-1,3-glucanase (GH17 family)